MSINLKILGRHIIVDFYDCDADKLKVDSVVEKIMLEATREAGATIISHEFRQFEPYGVSGVVIIQESHLTIHTWPEHSYAAVDIFTCGDEVNPWKAFEFIAKALDTENYETTELPRGELQKVKFENSEE